MFLLFICLLAVFGIVFPVSAFELGVRGYYWFPELSGDIRVDDSGIVGTELNLEDDLGVDDESYPIIEVLAGIGRHHLSLSFYNADYEGDVVLSQDIIFNGELFQVNERVVSNLEYDNYDFMYRYDLIDLENFLAGGSLGLVARLMVFDGSASITSTTVTTKEDFTAPIPMLGANYNSAFDGLAEISVTPFPFLDIHGGYRFFKIDVEEDDVKFDFDNSGLYVGLTVSF
jgi:hypothetical protein